MSERKPLPDSSPPSRSRLGRVLRWLLVGLLLLGLLAGGLYLWLTRSAGGRDVVLDQVRQAVESSTGWSIDADDFDLDLSEGRVGIDDIALGAPGEAPVVTAKRAEAKVEWSSLRGGKPRILDLQLDSPVLDLRNPLPPSKPDDGSEGGGLPTIEALRVRDGKIEGAAIDRGWLHRWRLEGVEADGSLVDDAFDIAVSQGDLVLERSDGRPPIQLQVQADASGPVDGPYQISDLQIDGDGFDLDASGVVGRGDDDPMRFSFELDAQPSRLLPELASGSGAIRASGDLDLRAMVGEVDLEIDDLPPEVVEPFVDPALMERLEAQGTLLDADATLRLKGKNPDDIRGEASVVWKRETATGSEILLELDAETVETAGDSLRFAFDGQLLPARADVVEARGALVAPSVSSLGEARLDGVDVTVRSPDLADLVAELERRWSGLLPDTDELPLRGQLDADATLSGPLDAIRVDDAEAVWRPTPDERPQSLVRLVGEGSLARQQGDVELTLERFDLAPLGYGIGGVLDGTASFSGSPRDYDLSTELVGRNIGALSEAPGTPDPPPWLAEVTLLASSDGRQLELERFEGIALLPGSPAAEDPEQLSTLEELERRAELEILTLDPAIEDAADLQTIDDPLYETGTVGGEARLTLRERDLEASEPPSDAEASPESPVIVARTEPVLDANRDGETDPGRAPERPLEIPDPQAPITLERLADVDEEALSSETPPESIPSGIADGSTAASTEGSTGDAAADPGSASDLPRGQRPVRFTELTPRGGDAGDAGGTETTGGVRQLPFAVAGAIDLALGTEAWVTGADLELRTERPVAGVESLAARLMLEDGTARVRLLDLEGAIGTPEVTTFEAVLPLGALAEVPGLGDAITALPTPRADGRIDVLLRAPDFDSAQLVAFLGLEDRPERVFGSIDAALTVDPAAPTAAVGTVTIESMAVELSDRRMEAVGPVVVRLGERRLALQRSEWSVDGNPFVLEADAGLAAGWQLDDDPGDLVERFDVLGDGTFALALLDPYLAGGTGRGLAEVLLTASGTPESYDGELRMTSSEGAIRFLSPYPTQLAEPEVVVGLDDGKITIREATAKLNQGSIEAEGVIDPEGTTRLEGFFDSVRYRVDYGLTLLASGNFTLSLPAESADAEPLLQANVLVERGFLRRNVDTDRELLELLLAPPELDEVDEEDGFSQELRLDIDVATVEGIYVRNNVADLKASWAPIRVEGTLAEPRVLGSVEVDPGGKIYAYGQVVRLDRAVLEFSGDPRVASELDIETTTSLDDPTIATPDDQRALVALSRRSAGPDTPPSEREEAQRKQEALGSGLETYYAGRLTSRLGRSLGGTSVEYKKLFIFSEADPQAQLVISRDLSARIALALALDLRNSEEKTYLLDLHEFNFMPSLSATLFTTEKNQVDGTSYGAALQQALELGRPGPRRDDDRPLLHDIEIECPACESERPIRNGLTYDKGERIEEGADFDIEVDVAESMRDAGFTAPTVRAELTARDADEVDLEIFVEPGPKATFEFTGETPPRKRRDGIRDLYRADFYEEAAIEEMREQTKRVWQSRGHPEPKVEVRVEALGPGQDADRRVVVHSAPGPKVDIETVRIEGVPEDVAEAIVDIRFDSTLARVELAVGEVGADRVLLRSLENSGFEDAAIESRQLEDDVLSIGVEAGERTLIDSIEVVPAPGASLDPDVAADLERRIEVKVGDPSVIGRVAQQANTLESRLRDEGYLDARVRNRAVVREDVTDRSRVVFEVDLGPSYRLDRIEVVGETHTDPDWIRDSSKLETGELLASTDIATARRRLVETGVFETVRVDAARGETDATVVTFDLEEKPRYSVAYGLRYSQADELGAALDVVDRNLLGRGISLGARALYAQQVSSLRLYTEIPRFLESPVDLEFFAEIFDEDFEAIAAEGFQLGGQATFPLAQNLRGRGYLRYRDADETNKTVIPPELTRQRSPVLGVQLIYDTRLDPLDPRTGLLASIDISGSSRELGADVRYLRGYAQLSHYWSPDAFEGDLVLAQSVRAGYADVISGVLPFDVRFFAGGQYSVRGYESRSLGERVRIDGDLAPLGGTAQLVFNEELRYRVFGDVWAVVFYDAGNVWSLAENFGGDLRSGYGLGTRVGTPVGLVRFDVGRAADPRPEDSEYQFYIGLGHAF